MESSLNAEQKHAVMDQKVLGHPAGLFVLFFTEMWERFSFYGMRVLLINFLTMSIIGVNPGWGWDMPMSTALYGAYAALLYLTPIVGGIIADKYMGYRKAVIIGCIVMALGHLSMAVETPTFLFIGLTLLVLGTGFFKPNITSIISNMYVYLPEKEDSAYTLYYMGVNAGAFFGMMLCGYLGERVGWSWGFGLAAVFLILGTIQFIFAKNIFGGIGESPKKVAMQNASNAASQLEKASIERKEEEKRKKEEEKIKKANTNPFKKIDILMIVVTSVIGLLYVFNAPTSEIGDLHLLPEQFLVSKDIISGPNVIILIGVVLFLILLFSRISRYTKVVRDRMYALVIFAIFTIVFFGAFEQAATSMITFARDFTQRQLVGSAATIYNIVNTLLTVVPLLIVTWVLWLLNKKSFMKIPVSNAVLTLTFALMWGLVGFLLYQNFSSTAYAVNYKAIAVNSTDSHGNKVTNYKPITINNTSQDLALATTQTLEVASTDNLLVGKSIFALHENGEYILLEADQKEELLKDYENTTEEYKANHEPPVIVQGTVKRVKSNEVEITVSWFSILNSFFIIAFSSIFSKWWESKYNPSAAMKYGFGLILMGIGFLVMAYGASVIPEGAAAGAIRVSMLWLILFYLFNTLGELCLSPVGLSYLSKLVPGRMIAFMFGMWYLAIAIGNYIAAKLGGMSTQIQQNHGMETFFLIIALIPIGFGILSFLLNPLLKRLMHDVK